MSKLFSELVSLLIDFSFDEWNVQDSLKDGDDDVLFEFFDKANRVTQSDLEHFVAQHKG